MEKTVYAQPALRAFLNARAKHMLSKRRMDELLAAALEEQERRAEREAERIRRRRPKLVASKG
jgi:hypothetical protein